VQATATTPTYGAGDDSAGASQPAVIVAARRTQIEIRIARRFVKAARLVGHASHLRLFAGALASASAALIAIRRVRSITASTIRFARSRASWAVVSALLRVARFLLGRSGSAGQMY
jgi:hypothetical protein